MTSFIAGLFRRALATVNGIPRTRSGHTGLHVEKLEPRHQCAVEVMQDGSYIVVDGLPDAGSLDIQHQLGESTYDDKVLVTWTSGGVSQSKSFDLYKFVDHGDERLAVKNVEYLEVSGGRGQHRFWNQTRLSSYLNEAADADRASELIFGDGVESIWSM